MKFIKLQIIGCINSFRVPEYHTYHKTLLFPPKTTICGMIGAGLGYPPEEVNEVLLPKLKIGILLDNVQGEAKDLWKIKKVTTYSKGDENKFEDCIKVGNKSYYGAVLVRELLYKSEYTIYISSDKSDLLNEVFNAIQNPQWALSLGREDELIKVKNSEFIELEEKSEQWFTNTILPFDINIEKFKIDTNSIVAKNSSQKIIPPMIYKLPTIFNYNDCGERTGTDFQTFSAILGIKIKPNKNSMGWVDGEKSFQIF